MTFKQKWTEEQTLLLRELWAKGHSASQVAERIGGYTRNAVIGKINRMELPEPKKKLPREYPSGVKRKIVKPKPKTKPKRKLPIGLKPIKVGHRRGQKRSPNQYGTYSSPYIAHVHNADAKAIGFDDLGARTCRFPVGESTGLDQQFCGKKCGRDDTYCKEHHAICWMPNSSYSDIKYEQAQEKP